MPRRSRTKNSCKGSSSHSHAAGSESSATAGAAANGGAAGMAAGPQPTPSGNAALAALLAQNAASGSWAGRPAMSRCGVARGAHRNVRKQVGCVHHQRVCCLCRTQSVDGVEELRRMLQTTRVDGEGQGERDDRSPPALNLDDLPRPHRRLVRYVARSVWQWLRSIKLLTCTCEPCRARSLEAVTPTEAELFATSLSTPLSQEGSTPMFASHGRPQQPGDDLDGSGSPTVARTAPAAQPAGSGVGAASVAAAPVRHAAPADFEMLATIGHGAFGKVFQVRHKATRRIYAMKVLKKQFVVAKKQVECAHIERNVMIKVCCGTMEASVLVSLTGVSAFAGEPPLPRRPEVRLPEQGQALFRYGLPRWWRTIHSFAEEWIVDGGRVPCMTCADAGGTAHTRHGSPWTPGTSASLCHGDGVSHRALASHQCDPSRPEARECAVGP